MPPMIDQAKCKVTIHLQTLYLDNKFQTICKTGNLCN